MKCGTALISDITINILSWQYPGVKKPPLQPAQIFSPSFPEKYVDIYAAKW